jgi:protease I
MIRKSPSEAESWTAMDDAMERSSPAVADATPPAFEDAPLGGREIAFLIAPEGAEQEETLRPWEAVTASGGHAVLVSTRPGRARLFEHLEPGMQVPIDRTVLAASPADYDALVLPGGIANPDLLRTVPEAVEFVRAFFESGKPVAAICHAPWLLVEAGQVRGRELTSWPSLRTDIANAGGIWRDRPVIVCSNGPNVLVSSRKPQDLSEFCDAMVDEFSHAPRR